MKLVSRAVLVVLIAVVAVVACKKDEKPEGAAPAKEGAAAVAAKAEPAQAPAIAIAKPADIPADVLAYGGISGFEPLTAVVGEIVAAFPGTPNPSAMMLQGIQASLSLKNLDWLDKGKPVFFVAYNEKKYPENALVLFPVNNNDAFATALPETKTGDATVGFSYDFMGKKFFMKVVDGYAVMSNDQALTTVAEPFLKATVIPSKLANVVELNVPVKGVTNIYGVEIDEAIKALEAAGSQGAPSVPFLDAQAVASLKGILAGAVGFVKDIELVKISLEYKDGTLAIPLAGLVTSGSKAAEKLAGMGARTSKLFSELPATSYFTLAFNVDPKIFLEYKDISLKMYKEIFKLSDEDMAKIGTFLDKAYELATGDGAFSASSFGGFPLSLVMVSGLKDARAYEALMADLWAFVEPKLVAFVKSEMQKSAGEGKPTPIQIQGETLQSILDALKPMVEPMGVKIELVNKDLKGHKLIGVTVSVDYANPMWAQNPEVAIAKAFLGDKLSFLCAGRDDNVYGCAFSPKGDEVMTAFADGKLGGGKLAGVSDAAARIVAKSSVFLVADVAGALKQFSAMPMVSMFKPKIDALQSADLYFYLRAAENGFESKLALPLKLIADVVGMFSGAGDVGAPAPAAPAADPTAPAPAAPAPAATVQ